MYKWSDKMDHPLTSTVRQDGPNELARKIAGSVTGEVEDDSILIAAQFMYISRFPTLSKGGKHVSEIHFELARR